MTTFSAAQVDPRLEWLRKHAIESMGALTDEERAAALELRMRIFTKCSDFPSHVAHAALMHVAVEELIP